MSYLWICVVLCLSGLPAIRASEDQEGNRINRLLPIFNVVNFPNDVCSTDTSRNGTCYTAEQCSSKSGTESGSCADGFGVCCLFQLSCGGEASENNTYLVQASVTTLTSPCTYTICKCQSDICRIRFDFTSFTLTGQPQGTSVAVGTAAPSATIGGALGQCITDQFTITGGGGTPSICGTNTGAHMIVDADDNCHQAVFNIGSTTTARVWDIYVTQYACGDEALAMGGPPGCLQYFTATTGVIENFNFLPTASNTVTATGSHPANHEYNICIRRAATMCFICYTAIVPAPGVALIAQGTFGLSGSPTINIAQSGIDTACDTDYLAIPGLAATPGTFTIVVANKVCGRFLASAAAATANASVCTFRTPFKVGVRFDGSEENIGTAINIATTNELSGNPGGIVGFRLVYTQGSTGCT